VVHVVMSCSDRKSVGPVPELRVSSLPNGTLDFRLSTWIDRLSHARPQTLARLLYQGEHWTVGRALLERRGVSVWIASAGYGLISAEAPIASYQATFAGGQPESVIGPLSGSVGDAGRASWWQGLQSRPERDGPILVELAVDGPIVIAASRSYLVAMEQEIVEAASRSPGRVIVATTGHVPSKLRGLRTPGDGRLRAVLGGSMQALNARLAARIAELGDDDSINNQSANDLTRELMTSAPPMDRYARESLSDHEVAAFIQDALVSLGPTSCSVLLRRLRDQGMACEQSRFRTIYHEARLKP
jgi:hypothetical protein